MMRQVLLSIIFTLVMHDGHCHDIISLRNLLYKANQNKAAAQNFMETMEATKAEMKPLISGYKAMAYMMWAKYTYNPINKLSYFVKGKNILNKAIQNDNKNVELRYLRYSVQTNAPAFLGYSDNINEDKQIISRNFEQMQDADLKQRIAAYLNNHEH